MILAGLKVIESSAACQHVRARTYAKRRAKSLRHWKRMDKKYFKRYGMLMVPQCYQMLNTLVVHPSLMPELRRVSNELIDNRIIGSYGL